MFFKLSVKPAISLFMAAFLLPAVTHAVYDPNIADVDFFKYGPTVNDAELPKVDEAAALVSLKGPDFIFYDKRITRIVVYENGYLGVGSTTGGMTPFPFPFTGTAPMIAAYWADADTTSAGTVYYRETQDSVYLNAVNTEINDVYGGTFAATTMLIVTWDEVGYCCSSPAAQNNSYQAVLATDGSASYVLLRYWDLQWTTGDRSGGSDGLGGSHAAAGLNAGDGQRFIAIQSSAMADVINIGFRSNFGKPGVYIYRTDPSVISPAPFMMFPYGTASGDTTLGAGDDADSGLISLQNNSLIYEQVVTSVIVSENGYIALNGQVLGGAPRAFPFFDDHAIVAPFWADVARSASQGNVYYRESFDSTLLKKATYYVLLANGGSFEATSLFIATWEAVGHEPDDFTQSNTFQAVIATDRNAGALGLSYIIFLYDSIIWTSSAQAGMNQGNQGGNFFSLPGSGTSQLADLDVTSNTGVPGVYILNGGRASLYPFGPSMSDRTLGRVDDHSIYVQLMHFTFPFYGTNHNNLRVYSNGYLTLSGTFGGFCPTLDSLTQAGTAPIVAPFFADADASSSYYMYNQGGIYFRETSDICLLDRAAAEFRSLAEDFAFRPTGLFIATWDHVGYSKMQTNRLNTFQAVLASNGTVSHILFLYNDIQWTASDPCGGNNGIGGYGETAQVGVSAGDGVRYHVVNGSGQARILAIDNDSNRGTRGVFLIPTDTETPAKVSSVAHSHTKTAYVESNADLVSELAAEREVLHRYQDSNPVGEQQSNDNVDRGNADEMQGYEEEKENRNNNGGGVAAQRYQADNNQRYNEYNTIDWGNINMAELQRIEEEKERYLEDVYNNQRG